METFVKLKENTQWKLRRNICEIVPTFSENECFFNKDF